MKAVELTIHNFRSLLDATIRLSPCGLLVGVNNSGKSTVIDCVRAFYDKGVKYEPSRDFPKANTEDQESWVEIEFQPSPEELENLKDDYKTAAGTFRVRKYFQSNENDSESKQKSGLYAYVSGELSGERFYGFKNVGQGKFGELIYVPAVSKVDEHTKLTGPSALRDLVSAVLTRVMDKSDAYQNLKNSFEAFEGTIKTESTEDGFSLRSIENDISAQISEWGTEFRLSVNPVGVDDLIKGLVGHEIFDTALQHPQSPSSYGQGFQRSLIYTLIRVAAKYAAEHKEPKKKEFAPELTWILFEEPEAFLHPTQVSSLSGDLRKLASTNTAQVLITTHSPQFATHNVGDLPALCRLHRDGCVSKAFQITGPELDAILSSNQADIATWVAAGIKVDQDDLQTDMEGIKYALWLDAKRCAAMFAERVLLVEGPTETALLSYLYDNDQLTCCRGIYVVDTIGKYNIHRFMRLFGHLGIKHYALYDGDNGKHAPVEATILAAANKFTGGLDSFPSDIEEFLGVPRANKPHRKPQHMMMQIASGKVNTEKLQALVQKIEKLVSA